MQDKDKIDELLEAVEEVTNDISDVGWLDVPALVIFAALFIIVALQFFTRYVLNDSLGWTEEIARYFLILLGFVGAVSCTRRGKHIFLEFAYHYVPVRAIKPIILLVEIITIAFWAYASVLAVELAQKTNSNMVSVDLPKAYLYYVVSFACACMSLFSFAALVRQVLRPAQDIINEKIPFAVKAG
ncbi:TRAP transporter small permease [Tritonibacter horizontis]|uniref:TRAP transporter small permease protein n=1 Tax=Tritonibacter horizontis TaxID=1768241 RepID=A0A132C3J9_9RHOB|nr:TRAP transporter small permease [Tritonibacter horizontis]KUP94567.1 tripartite ATP-independent periplasmic transporter, DctQ component [Tritonibacter horizontis]